MEPGLAALRGWLGGELKHNPGARSWSRPHTSLTWRVTCWASRRLCTPGHVKDLPNYDVEDASTVAIQFACGAVGNLMSCCASRAGGSVHLTISAVHHYMSFTGWEHSLVIRKSPIEEERITGEPNIFEIEDDAFVRAVSTADATPLKSCYSDGVRT
jgi:hypothetical protein